MGDPKLKGIEAEVDFEPTTQFLFPDNPKLKGIEAEVDFEPDSTFLFPEKPKLDGVQVQLSITPELAGVSAEIDPDVLTPELAGVSVEHVKFLTPFLSGFSIEVEDPQGVFHLGGRISTAGGQVRKKEKRIWRID